MGSVPPCSRYCHRSPARPCPPDGEAGSTVRARQAVITWINCKPNTSQFKSWKRRRFENFLLLQLRAGAQHGSLLEAAGRPFRDYIVGGRASKAIYILSWWRRWRLLPRNPAARGLCVYAYRPVHRFVQASWSPSLPRVPRPSRLARKSQILVESLMDSRLRVRATGRGPCQRQHQPAKSTPRQGPSPAAVNLGPVRHDKCKPRANLKS